MAALHIASIFVSAFLLFLLQPMIAKTLLPAFGGSPAVWGTCLVVFQGLVLAGYAWADRVRRLPPRTQAAVQALTVLLPILLLPPALRTAPPAPSAWPIPALVLALGASVAAPFFALSTNSTMVQSWYARSAGREPYFLYAASNAGSLLALLAYPFALEPRLGLSTQRLAFSAGYALFALLSAVLATLALRGAPGAAPAAPSAARGGGASPRTRARWLWLAAVPSGLLVSTTLHVSTDVAAVPLLWVLPLALYLLSFVLAFLPRRDGRLGVFPRDALSIAASILVALVLLTLHTGTDVPYVLQLLLSLATLLTGAWLCHGELAAARPPAEGLGGFYLRVSAGGLAGGVFGNLVAPLLFDSVVEYPLFLVALTLVTVEPRALFSRRALVPLAVGAAAVAGPVVAIRAGYEPSLLLRLVPLAILPAALAARRRPERFAVAAAVIAVYVTAELDSRTPTLDAERSFFGVVRVVEEAEDYRVMLHGTTAHGFEFRKTPYPIGYYYPDAPIPVVVGLAPDGARVGVVGLGTGAVAKLVRAGQSVDFYEIDPIVEPLARSWFSYLGGSPAQVRTVLGDARLTLERSPAQGYDLLVMDAFTSDAIPVHLITREAIALYLSRLRPDGRLLVHVSNRYLDVVPVIRSAARALGVPGRRLDWRPTAEQVGWGAQPSSVVVLAAREEPLAPLVERGWEPLEDGPGVDWTDDRSSLLEVVRRGSWMF